MAAKRAPSGAPRSGSGKVSSAMSVGKQAVAKVAEPPAPTTAAKVATTTSRAPAKKPATKAASSTTSTSATTAAPAKKAAPVKKKAAATTKTTTTKAASATKATTTKAASAAKRSASTSAPAKAAPAKAAPSTKAGATKAAPATKASATKKAAPARAAKKAPLVVREDESPWTAKELKEVRAAIEADIAQLSAELAHAESELSDLMRDSGDGAGDDQADAGAKTWEREQEIALADNAREMLRQNEHALERLDNGTYGVCESCGQPIGKLRLQAAPRATLCRPCKMKQERR